MIHHLLLAACILLLSPPFPLSPPPFLAAGAGAGAFLHPNSTHHPYAHPDPESVVREVQRQVETSRRRALLEAKNKDLASGSCLTGNPIDDCWRCFGDWQSDRQRLADCGLGFGRGTLGGKAGPIYVVTDPSDDDPVNPAPGTLRYGAIQEGPLWIVFTADMTIHLKEELLVNSFKTIDGRGFNVQIADGACITLQYVSDVILHNLHIHHCVPTGEANVRSSPTHYGWRGRSDGDGVSIYSARNIWVDHCSLSYCADGLIDAIMGSTAITISNNYFSHHNEVMLLGHRDDYLPDSGMQVTIAFNHFGEALVQRMPRCRLGHFHVVNNDFSQWEMYAIGGSANPTINSQGNRYTAPSDPNAKEVTKRVDTDEKDWVGWNWRTEGDIMVNGAFFVPSGEGLEVTYAKAESLDPKPAALIDQLTMNAGVLGGPRDNEVGTGYSGVNNGGLTADGGGGGAGGGAGYGYLGMVFGSGAPSSPSHCHSILLLSSSLIVALFSILCLHPS
ncbi:probable pectate lyase 18 [Phoenix dactylifera]|uniref:Pectate lyase n=1 Tax=Phoenix dactylifera TaxID=42345 RepID=A0A8B8ZSD8_PHODC|nr:probable pectate lyase 18 [Phoenix dactylifera]